MAAQAPSNCACHHRSIRPRTAGQAFAGVRSRSSTASCEVLASCQSSPTHHRSLRLPQTSAVRRDVRVYNRKRNSIPKDARGPDGMVQYETMLVLRPDLSDDSRDVELAKFQSFLEREKASNIVSNIRTVQQLAYPIAGYWNAIYVLFSYSARRSTAVSVQSLLSKPAVGSEKQILRFGTFRLA